MKKVVMIDQLKKLFSFIEIPSEGMRLSTMNTKTNTRLRKVWNAPVSLKNSQIFFLTYSPPTHFLAIHIVNHHSACLGYLCGHGCEIRG